MIFDLTLVPTYSHRYLHNSNPYIKKSKIFCQDKFKVVEKNKTFCIGFIYFDISGGRGDKTFMIYPVLLLKLLTLKLYKLFIKCFALVILRSSSSTLGAPLLVHVNVPIALCCCRCVPPPPPSPPLAM